MKAKDYRKGIPKLADTVANEGTFITTGDLMFYADIVRLNANGDPMVIEVEIHGDWDGVGEAARVHKLTPMGDGTAVLADANIVLCDEEDFFDDFHEWRKECVEYDAEIQEANIPR
jgi:hypothetical protein